MERMLITVKEHVHPSMTDQADTPTRGVMLLVDVGDRWSLCVVNDQPVGNPKRKV
jgi:hypothetical protein